MIMLFCLLKYLGELLNQYVNDFSMCLVILLMANNSMCVVMVMVQVQNTPRIGTAGICVVRARWGQHVTEAGGWTSVSHPTPPP